MQWCWATTRQHFVKRTNSQQALNAGQPIISPWTKHQELTQPAPPTDNKACHTHRSSMFPAGCAGTHPAAPMLKEWATFGCPTHRGKPWSKEEMWEAIARAPHCSLLSPGALEHFTAEAAEKVRTGQARVIAWDSIKDNPPKELKISPIPAIPHKSKSYRFILDLSFWLRLANGSVHASINDIAKKTALAGKIGQICSCLSRIIHVFSEADEGGERVGGCHNIVWGIKCSSKKKSI